LATILLSVSKLLSQVYIVIDGLDECKLEERLDLLSNVQSLLNTHSALIKLCVASREETDIKISLRANFCINILEAKVTSDITSFVREVVMSKFQSRELRVGDPDLLKNIILALVNGARGM
jgi:hypothetical protein